MLELGVITRAIANHSNTFCPPLVTTDAQIDRIIDAFATAAGEQG
jgi:adenosylmethionine-8-amino-7-oxononanoate aminotransferase